MAIVPDLPPSYVEISNDLIKYFQQMIAEPTNTAANPKKLGHIVAFFDDEGPRVYVIPGRTYNHMGWVGGTSDDIPATMLKRSDTALSVIYQKEENGVKVTGRWIYAGGNHGSS